MYYKNLGQEELWLDCAEKLTAMIQNIIEFAKLIPGFMRLSQDDQVSDRQEATTLIENILCNHFCFLSVDDTNPPIIPSPLCMIVTVLTLENSRNHHLATKITFQIVSPCRVAHLLHLPSPRSCC